MNWRAIWAITRRDMKVVTHNKGVMLPLILVPLILLIAMPAVVALIPGTSSTISGFDTMLNRLPASLQQELVGLSKQQQIIVLALVYFLAPFYLIVPLMVANVIAADSFAGEKERKTLEALLYTPTSDRELLIAKVLAAWLPALAVSLGGFVAYALVANLAAWPIMERIFFPPPMWLVLALWVAPAIAGVGLGIMVLVSARAKGFQDASQLGGMVVLPLLLLIVGQVSGVIYFSVWLTALLGLLLWGVDALLLWFGARLFRRNEMIARL